MNPNRGGSYISSPYWIKNKKATTNPINPILSTAALNHEEIKKDLQRETKKISIRKT